jgi:hypothetical protein
LSREIKKIKKTQNWVLPWLHRNMEVRAFLSLKTCIIFLYKNVCKKRVFYYYK